MSTTLASTRLLPAATPLFDHSGALTRHLQQCRAAHGRFFRAAAWGELAHGLVAPRFITTVSVAVLLLLVISG